MEYCLKTAEASEAVSLISIMDQTAEPRRHDNSSDTLILSFGMGLLITVSSPIKINGLSLNTIQLNSTQKSKGAGYL